MRSRLSSTTLVGFLAHAMILFHSFINYDFHAPIGIMEMKHDSRQSALTSHSQYTSSVLCGIDYSTQQ